MAKSTKYNPLSGKFDFVDEGFFGIDGSIQGEEDGSGFVVKSSLYDDAIGFNGITPDKDNYVFVDNLQVNGIINHTIASGQIRQLGTGNLEEHTLGAGQYVLTNDPVSGGFNNAWLYLGNNSSWLGAGQTGGANGTSVAVGMSGGTGYYQMYVDNQRTIISSNQADFTQNNPRAPMIISSQNSTLNGDLHDNSVILGGRNIIINKSNYAFAENFEIQGSGVSRYSATPALATSLDMAHRGYVDGRYVSAETYTPTNFTLSRTFDANNVSTHQLADVVATIINDLQNTPQAIFQ
jgi:hypothetical protein